MARRELIVPTEMANIYRDKRYAPGVRVGDMLYVSGSAPGSWNLISRNIAVRPKGWPGARH